SMKISFADISFGKSGALAIVVTEGATPSGVAADLDRKTGGAIKRAMKAAAFTGKSGSSLDLVAPQGVTVSRIILMGAGKISDLSATGMENIGGELIGKLDRT